MGLHFSLLSLVLFSTVWFSWSRAPYGSSMVAASPERTTLIIKHSWQKHLSLPRSHTKSLKHPINSEGQPAHSEPSLGVRGSRASDLNHVFCPWHERESQPLLKWTERRKWEAAAEHRDTVIPLGQKWETSTTDFYHKGSK